MAFKVRGLGAYIDVGVRACKSKWVTAGAGSDWPGLLRCRGTGWVFRPAAAHRGADPPGAAARNSGKHRQGKNGEEEEEGKSEVERSERVNEKRGNEVIGDESVRFSFLERKNNSFKN